MTDSLRGLKLYLKKYADLIESRKQNVDIAEEEFQRIKQQANEDKKSLTSFEGAKEINRKKNRYKDILPFDHTRVILPKDKFVDGSDYINANLIKDDTGQVCYIASQGPMPNTVDDFWRMVIYFKVRLIIMACKEVELGKQRCQRYWPYSNESMQSNDIKITLVKEKKYAENMKLRELKAVKNGKEHVITQLHYMDWPDHGAPETSETILHLITIARQKHPEDDPPVLIHCSAGCGRTGAIIAIDYARKLIQAKVISTYCIESCSTQCTIKAKKINVHHIVTNLRKQRPAMVQTKEQYEFIYEVVREMVSLELSKYDSSFSCDSNPTYVNIGFIPQESSSSPPADDPYERMSFKRSQSDDTTAFLEEPAEQPKKQIVLPSEHMLNTDLAFRRSRSLYGRNSPRMGNKFAKVPDVPRKASESGLTPRPKAFHIQDIQQDVVPPGKASHHPALPPNKPKANALDTYVNLEPAGMKSNEEYIPPPKTASYSSYPMKSTTSHISAPLKPVIVAPPSRSTAIPPNTLLSSAAQKLSKNGTTETPPGSYRTSSMDSNTSNSLERMNAQLNAQFTNKTKTSHNNEKTNTTHKSHNEKNRNGLKTEGNNISETNANTSVIKPYYVTELGNYNKSEPKHDLKKEAKKKDTWQLSIESGTSGAPPLPERTPGSYELVKDEDASRKQSSMVNVPSNAAQHASSSSPVEHASYQPVQHASTLSPVDLPPSPLTPTTSGKYWYNAISKMKNIGKKQPKSTQDDHIVTPVDTTKQKYADTLNELQTLGYPKRINHKLKGPRPQPGQWPSFPS